jgi:phosphoribosyl-ATP pyrophosphohydrolase/phosphoribosyl-AMP cyclohydrolase
MKKEIIAYINAENELGASVVSKAERYERNGLDALFIYNYSANDLERDEFLHTCRTVKENVDLPLFIGFRINRFEDAKKAFYTGAEKLVIPYASCRDMSVIKSVTDRFGKDRVFVEVNASPETGDGLLSDQEFINECSTIKVAGFVIKHLDLSTPAEQNIAALPFGAMVRDSLVRNDIMSLMSLENVFGVATNYYDGKDVAPVKQQMKRDGIDVAVLDSEISFADLKKDASGLVPVVVQDYYNNEVLMVAYMNEEAYNATLATGRMTYYSRSRKELWEKGLTSGHFQYLKELLLDCDSDTLLAKVKQVGAACHTGSRSCFYKQLAKADYVDLNPLNVLSEDYKTIIDRREHPKEGSYTNYLFDKGLDKILKKCGEEATEIVIAAKNPDKEDIKYEIADFLYHMMVLMAECNVDWNDIVRELVNRRT